jgi:hypothetical protein
MDQKADAIGLLETVEEEQDEDPGVVEAGRE